MKILALTILILLTNISFGQQHKYDTLFFAHKKYLLEIEQKYNVCPYDFPFAIAEHHYKYINTEKYYKTIDNCGCGILASYTPSGNEILSYGCSEYKTKEYNLNNFTDSVNIDLSDFGEIYVKTATTKYLIEKIQFKLIFDSTMVIINPDINQKIERFNVQIRDAFYKVKPNYIILNEMLYTDKKGKLQLIPRQFIITLK